MKKTFALALATLSISSAVLAQDVKTGNTISGNSGRPASLAFGSGSGMGNFLDFLFRRIHTLNIDTSAQQMQADGVTERKYIAGFSASGALVYQHELDGDSLDEYNDTGRNVGVQLVPYTLKYSTDGKLYLAINPISLKNMIAHQGGENAWTYAGFFTVVDDIDFIVLKWDKGMSFDNYDSYTLDMISTNLKLDILSSSKTARYLALTAGGTLGMSRGSLKLDSGETIHIGTENSESGLSFRSNYRYGIEYNDQWSNGSRLNMKFGAQHTHQNGYYLDNQKVAMVAQQNASNKVKFQNDLDKYNIDAVGYTTDKLAYEHANLNGTVISDDSYKALTNKLKPVKPGAPSSLVAESDRIVRRQIYLTPSIEFSKRVSKDGSRPIRIGVGMDANIPVRDVIQGGRVNMDMSGHNRNLLNARLFINF